MGRTDTPIKPFINDCRKKGSRGEGYRGFKQKVIEFPGGFTIFIMAILFPRKKTGFNHEFEDIFKDYEVYQGRPYAGYHKKDNIRTTIKKNKKLYVVLFNQNGILIFCEKRAIENLLKDDDLAWTKTESPYSSSYLPDSDKIEEIYEEILNERIIPKLLEKFKTLDGAICLASPSSGYGSTLDSPCSDFSSLPSDPNISPEDIYKMDYSQENTAECSFYGGSNLVKNSANDVLLLPLNPLLNQNDLTPDTSNLLENLSEVQFLGKEENSPFKGFKNESSKSSRNQLIQSCKEAISFEDFALMQPDASSPKLTQPMIDDLIMGKLGEYVSPEAVDSNFETVKPTTASEILPCALDHNYSTFFKEENYTEQDRHMEVDPNPEPDKCQISLLNQAQWIDFGPNSEEGTSREGDNRMAVEPIFVQNADPFNFSGRIWIKNGMIYLLPG